MPVQATIVAGAVFQIGPIVDASGLRFAELLERVDLSLDDLSDPDRRLPLPSVCEMLELAAVEAGNDALALEVASQYRPGSSGVLGYAMLAAPTVGQSLKDVHRFTRLICTQQGFDFERRDGVVEAHWSFPPKLVPHATQYISFVFLMFVRRLQLAAGDTWRPTAVNMGFSKPANAEAYLREFGPGIKFGVDRFSVRFGEEILELPMPQSDERLHKFLTDLGDYRLSELDAGSDVVDRTQDQIIRGLNHGPVSIEDVAREMGQSVRSLQRRLKEENTSFQTVLEKNRRLLARHYLRSQKHSLTEIAFLLGFSEQSAFTRACKRWFGATPQEMRHKLA